MGIDPSLHKCRVLVVGINYWPEVTGIAPYTTAASDFLAGRNHEVLVLTGFPHYPQWKIPHAYSRRFRTDEENARVKIRRLRHYVPRRQSAFSRSAYEATFGLQILRQSLPWRPDVILGVMPSLLGSVAAAHLARRYSAPLVLWVQDLMGAATTQSGIRGGRCVATATDRIQAWTFRQAQSIVTVSSAFNDDIARAEIDLQRVHLIPNWTHVPLPLTDRSLVRSRLGWRPDDIVVLHSGNMGLKQGLHNVIEAAKLADQQDRIRFVLMGDGSQRTLLAQLALGVPALDILPPAPSTQFSDVLAAADILLVNEAATAVTMSLPSKLTSYFGVGVPVIAAVPPVGATAIEVERSGGGWVIPPEDPGELLAAVRLLAADAQTRRTLGRAGLQYSSVHLSERSSLAQLAAVMSSAVSDPNPEMRVAEHGQCDPDLGPE